MKKLFLCVPVLAMLVLSCTLSVNTIYDESVPLEQSSWINPYVGTITGYNGITVKWERSGNTLIQIPSGDTLLEFDLYAASGNTIYRGSGILFRYNFQPGKQYFFWATTQDSKLGLRVYAYDIKEKVSPTWQSDESHFLEFVLFLNIDSEGTTVLN